MLQNAMNRYRRMGLQRRLLLLVTILVLLASYIAYGLDFVFTRHLLTENASENYQALNAQIIKNMEDSLKTMQNAAIAAGYSSELQRYMQKTSLNPNEASEMYERILTSLRMMYHTISDAQVMMVIPGSKLEYNSIHVGALEQGYRHEQDKWYLQVKQEGDKIRTFVLDNPQAYYHNGRLSHTMVIAVPHNSNNNTLGVAVYVLMDMERNLFEQYIAQSTLDVFGSILISQRGELVYSDLDGDVRDWVVNDLEGGSSGTQRMWLEGEQYIAVYDTSEFTGWRVVTLLRLDQLNQQLASLSIAWNALILVTLVCMLPIIYRFSKRTTRPLAELSAVMRRVREGDLMQRAYGLEIGEFEALGKDFNRMLDQILALMKQNEQMAMLQKQTELNALQQQINPHFLFNTLGMIIGLSTEAENEKIIRICESMGTLMRYAISYQEQVALQEEIRYTQAYLAIVQLRHEGLFDVALTVDPSLEEARIVKMCLQPIIENAVKHGFADRLQRGILRIDCACDPQRERLILTVEDSGAGMCPDTLTRLRETLKEKEVLGEDADHIGLRNVHMRLRLRYGERASMQIDSVENEGTRVVIMFPLVF